MLSKIFPKSPTPPLNISWKCWGKMIRYWEDLLQNHGSFLSSTSDCIIFLFLGIALVEGPQYWHTGFTVWTITFTLICRFIGTYTLTFFANRRRIRKVNLQEMFIMAYGGLRGAVGFSLVEMIDADVVPPAQMFVTTTLAVVMFTIFIQVIRKLTCNEI